MSDIIQLLPEAVANQIAAGEVVQRPASIVKELMENAIDAGATHIQLIVKDAGKTLIQVVDNGKGMSEMDARMCFERHATSKIKKTDDLFHIVTKGFRGEALASIAAVAQVEMKTRQSEQELGTRIEIEGSKIKVQEPVSTAVGTNFMVRNLFFNVPARRYFLKSDSIEFKHIVDEFQRLALTHFDVEFSLHHNGTEVFHLPKVSLRQRIVHVFGNKYNEKLVPVEESTDIVKVSGFVGKPDASKKTRGEQFFFVNNRFIRNAYLHHATMSAFEGLLPQGNFPLYLLYLEIDPEQIDINIHPTKTEIKFQDERAIYAILLASAKRALGRHSIAPTLDFEQEQGIQISPLRADTEVKMPQVRINPDFNPFEKKQETKSSSIQNWFDEREKKSSNWQELYAITKELESRSSQPQVEQQEVERSEFFSPTDWEDVEPLQLFRKYVLCQTEDGLVMIDQQRAHQRILFEKYLQQLSQGAGAVQQLLFPEQVQLDPGDYALVLEMKGAIEALGFSLQEQQNCTVEIVGVPAESDQTHGEHLLQTFLEQLKNESALQSDTHEKLAWAMSKSTSIRYGQMLTIPEMKELVQRLFACRQPYFTQRSKNTMVRLNSNFFDQQFK